MRANAAALGACALIAMGCNALLGVEELPRGACTTCVQQSCGQQARDCAADADCSRLATCYEGCVLHDADCRFACGKEHRRAAALPVWQGYEDCLRGACVDECLGSRLLTQMFEVDCASCIVDRCTDEARACVQDAGCERAWACVDEEPCRDPRCIQRCIHDVGAWGDAGADWVRCARECVDVCDIGEDWACVDGFTWPVPDESFSSFDIERWVHDALFDQQDVTGVKVSACTAASCGAAGEVRADQRVVVSVPTTQRGFRGYLHLEGPNASGDAFVTSHHYVGAYLSFPGDNGDLGIMSEQNLADVKAQIPLDSDLAYFSFYIQDCLFNGAPGIEIDIDPAAYTASTEKFYQVKPRELSSSAEATTHIALGGMSNLEPGTYDVVARHIASDTVVAREANVRLIAGVWVHVVLHPISKD